jgi:hypothetical protein
MKVSASDLDRQTATSVNRNPEFRENTEACRVDMHVTVSLLRVTKLCIVPIVLPSPVLDDDDTALQFARVHAKLQTISSYVVRSLLSGTNVTFALLHLPIRYWKRMHISDSDPR